MSDRLIALLLLMSALCAVLLPGRAAAALEADEDGLPIGVFEYEEGAVLMAPEPPDFFLDAQNKECASRELNEYDKTFAEIMKVDLDGVCSDDFVLEEDLSEREICKAGDIAPYTFGEIEHDRSDVVLVNLDLESYRLDKRAIDSVNNQIQLMSTRWRSSISLYLQRSNKYINLMKNILREEGLPEDIAYLPLIESGFNTKAYSRSRAAGPWQFMPRTAKHYGLKVDWWVDERRDPVKSTRAAARYLSYLHGMFDSWSLAMAAYNAGEGKIDRALRKTKSRDYWALLGTRHIKPETKNYVPKFIAARMIAVEPERYGFKGIEYHDEFSFDEVSVNYSLSLDVIAKCTGTTTAAIKELNPELNQWMTPPVKDYRLRIPLGSKERFLDSMAKLPEDQRITVKRYKVRTGDTISHISMRTGVPKQTIISFNKLSKRGFIREGQMLLLPIPVKVM